MGHIKMLGLAAITAVALTASVGAGSASATELTCNGVKCPVGTVIHANSNGHATLHTTVGTISCNVTFEGGITNGGGSATTASSTTGTLTFTGCTNGAVVKTLKGGTLEFHSTGGGNGTLTSSGMEVTISFSGFHCIFGTSNTDIGTVTTNTSKGGSASFDMAGMLKRTGGSSGIFCGSDAQWTGSLQTTKPTSLIIH